MDSDRTHCCRSDYSSACLNASASFPKKHVIRGKLFPQNGSKMYKKMVLWHEFDDNVATVASITTGMSSFRQNNAREGRWFKLGFGLLTDGA